MNKLVFVFKKKPKTLRAKKIAGYFRREILSKSDS